MNEADQFAQQRAQAVRELAEDPELRDLSLRWMIVADQHKYSYNFSWLGRPIIKLPGDIVVMQEMIWQTKPDLIIETGIAHGGSLIFSASMLELIGHGEVLGIDIDIRSHNRTAIENHKMSDRIQMIEGSSTDPEVVEKVAGIARDKKKVLVVLDSLHTHKHVLDELRIYSQFVSVGSYLVLPDTFIEHFPKGYFRDRPWDVGDNPMTAMREFLVENDCFEIDQSFSSKALISEAIDGYLIRVK
jgi:cephalosporin hydroxylase